MTLLYSDGSPGTSRQSYFRLVRNSFNRGVAETQRRARVSPGDSCLNSVSYRSKKGSLLKHSMTGMCAMLDMLLVGLSFDPPIHVARYSEQLSPGNNYRIYGAISQYQCRRNIVILVPVHNQLLDSIKKKALRQTCWRANL